MRSKKQVHRLILAESRSEDPERKQKEKVGVEESISIFRKMLASTNKGLGTAIKIASICAHDPKLREIISNDPQVSDWATDLSEAFYALSRLTPYLQDRIVHSMSYTPELYNKRDLDEDVNKIPYI